MRFHLHQDPLKLGLASMEDMTREEVATIWFALTEYAEQLEDGLGGDIVPSTVHEDRAFVYGTLAKVHQLMFDIKENHEGFTKQLVQGWLDA
jgi:hypothetical protein